MQDKKKSAIESITNTVARLGISFMIQLIIYPLFGIAVTFGQNLLILGVFFIASFVRNYVIRRFFTSKPPPDKTNTKTIRVRIEDVISTDLIVSEFEGEQATFILMVKPERIQHRGNRMFWKQMVTTDITQKSIMFYCESGQLLTVIRDKE